MSELYAQLGAAETPEIAQRVLRAIDEEWGRTGSPTLDLMLERGRNALMAGDFLTAAEHLTVVIETAPDLAQPYQMRATAYYMAGLAGAALSDLGEALIRDPKQFIALQGLAVLLEELGKPEEAIEVYRAVLAIHPWDTDIRNALARLEQALEGQEL